MDNAWDEALMIRRFFIHVLLLLLAALVLTAPADARPRHHHRSAETTSTISMSSVGHHPKQLISRRNRQKTGYLVITHRDTARPIPPGLHRVMAEGAGRIVGGRPPGCPHRYCGCGASLHIFGRIIPRLNLAANWLRFPRAAPAPGMVAARRHHVFVLKRHIRGKIWLVHDSNSGRGKTRVHPRSIAGFVIVDPRADS